MIIYDPYEILMKQLIEMRNAQLYRCVVDGEDTFRGERLPIGTRDQILAWLNDRYRVVDELRLGSPDRIIVYSYLTWIRREPPLRYLVVVQGAEKLFTLYPVPDGLLTWNHRPGPSVQVQQKKREE